MKKKVHYKKSKNRKSRIRSFIIKIVLITIILTVALVMLARTDYFKISTIKVTGNTHYKDSDIIKTANIKKGENGFIKMGINPADIFTLSFGKAQKTILSKYPYMENVIVRYNIPNKVNIEVKEREPYYIIDNNGEKIIVDDNWYALEKLASDDTSKFSKLKILYGIKFDKFKLGQKIKVKSSGTFNILNILTDAIKSNDENNNPKIYGLIKSVDLENLNNVKVSIKPDITVNFGDLEDLDYRITYLKQIYSKYISSNESGFLDFSTGDNPVFQSE